MEAKRTLYELLRKRYPESQYALMSEVSNAAGFDRSRSADFVVMGLWPSRGLDLEGIELKSYRSDWLNELKKPEKAEATFKYCDKFWLLTNGENIAKPEEIPPSWGWMEIKHDKVFLKKEAPKLSPMPLPRTYLAALLKRAASKDGYVLRSEIDAELKAQYERGQYSKDQEHRNEKERHKELEKIIAEYKDITGVDLLEKRYFDTTKRIGEAVKFLQDKKPEQILGELLHLQKIAGRIHAEISTGVNIISEHIPIPTQL